MADRYDYIIVGAGSAGCVLANRLSARAANSVLLIEAGDDTPPGEEPADIRDPYPASYYNKTRMWPGLRAHWRRRDNSPEIAFPQGRIMGGSSSVMGMIALRGTPDDFDEWAAAGAAGWGWADVLPYFNRLEQDLDFEGPLHGEEGPVPIRRVAETDWPPLTRAIRSYAVERRMPFIADMNADFRDGYGALPMSNRPDRRASAATCYLGADVRRRPNLAILTGATVTRLLFEGFRVVGVAVHLADGERTFRAGEVVLSAGAIHSPAMLLAAGIGAASHLRAIGIDVRLDRPGVGANLQNHAILFVAAYLKRTGRQPSSLRTHPTTCLRLSSGLPNCPHTDLYINIQSKTSWNALGRRIANLAPALWRPWSRGSVRLSRAPDGALAPLVEFNFMDDERDLDRMVLGFRRVADIFAYAPVQNLAGQPFCVRFTDRIRQLNALSRANAVRASLIAAAFDLVPGLAAKMLASLSGPHVDIQALAADEERLREHIRQNIAGMFHAVGTCRIGEAADPQAVTDAEGRIYGVERLRVVDASLMPVVPRGNTNIPTIMVAEKIADRLLSPHA